MHYFLVDDGYVCLLFCRFDNSLIKDPSFTKQYQNDRSVSVEMDLKQKRRVCRTHCGSRSLSAFYLELNY